MSYSGYPQQNAAIGFSIPQQYQPQPGMMQPGYPTQQAYPPQQGYPSQQMYPHPTVCPYPTQQQAYLPQPGYPPQPGFSTQPVYPPQQGYHPPQQAYAPQTGYNTQPGYPSSTIAPVQSAYSVGVAAPSQGMRVPLPVANTSMTVQAHVSPNFPTLVAERVFDPTTDAQSLKTAMKGYGCDKKTLIYILTRRSGVQRMQIVEAFRRCFGKDLLSELRRELRGDFEHAIISFMTPVNVYLAQEIHHAVKGFGTDEADLVEILCTANNQTLKQISICYQTTYGIPLERALLGDTSGDFKNLLIAICRGYRDESMTLDPVAARADAQALYRAGALILGTNESTFNKILVSRSYIQLQLVIQEYQKLTGRSLATDINREFSGPARDGLQAIISSTLNKPQFFAERLRKSMAGMGTSDRDLTRILVTRCEIDLGNIKQEYRRLYGTTLANDISKDTSGDYRNFLLTLVGEESMINSHSSSTSSGGTFNSLSSISGSTMNRITSLSGKSMGKLKSFSKSKTYY